ncbi:glycosyl transferase, group 1 [Staphylothermus marinus F1]|uniref:Glycosyl transferase, group 1 n=1 Tax=Staphylothermus marinus (strain ATCC 43588 / DSM 3639 / JCM 9404 / F1) TaxID=399550 RepID=A3DN36_STAMF|nr:glycosyltransferase [Staphylothermus marinus]ABN70046.1 glycosyl transferase, group 1 [Staphylothermus marinus F1]
MRIAIVHHDLNFLGGGERLCLTTIEAFKECGWSVVLATLKQTDWSRISHIWGRVIKPDEEIIFSIPIKGFTIYKRLLSSFMFSMLRKDVDLIINTYGNPILTNADITYMHFPTFALWDESHRKYEEGFWKLYFTPYYLVSRKLVERRLNTLILTNSKFTAAVINKLFNRRSFVVYPPVNVNKYIQLEGRRENNIVSIGRFSPEKRYELVVEIAEKLKDFQFYIIGSIANTEEKMYYEKIKNMIEERDLKNIELIPNAPDENVRKILSTSKVYLHCMVNEHFGIAVVEGMASGLVPVVHRSGGTWHDIVEHGKYGYGYTSSNEAIKMIRHAIYNYEKMKPLARKRSLVFSRDRFKKKIIYIVREYVRLANLSPKR